MSAAIRATAGPSRLQAATEADDDDDASEHVRTTMSDAVIAIKNLDRLAFQSPSDADRHRPNKIVRVADVDGIQTARSRSHFSRLSGIDSLHREKARIRKSTRNNKSFASTHSSTVKERTSNTYRPLSLDQLLQRLTTFTISSYSNKPTAKALLGPLGMAMNGWLHASGQQRDDVQCVTCTACWHVTSDAAETSTKSEHEGWCPWRIRSCHASLYRVPIRSTIETRAELLTAAERLALRAGLDELAVATPKDLAVDEMESAFRALPVNAVILAVLGWQTDTPDDVRIVNDTIVSCRMCARRAGLWAYVKEGSSKRIFDPVGEHKEYCPVVNPLVQSGRWLDANRTVNTKLAEAVPAWQLKFRLLQANLARRASPSAHGDQSAHSDVRTLRSHEIIGTVKNLLDGRT